MHAAGLQADLGLGRLEWIDPEYTRGESLRTAVSGLGRVDVVWVAGGNTYNLAHHVHASGGGEIIKDLLADGTVFVGASAGSILAGRTVQTVFWKNWDDQTCEGTVNVDWKDAHVSRGLDVAGGISIFPHANGPYGGADWQNEQAQRHGHNDHTVVRLADGQGVVVEDGTYRLV
ncbi:hypothetical protein M885DRAFT_508435 [Pelagophyceae sp. CCMP2097]|nr:hypothetical protein M885DRAFT_508435 [Pelagophyceae sp. CCMP2097]|mmetsp:Transcript_25776/g.86602  ORF Transcript_25776/g.86602 Transcript_25776/m.86602 type:complete len:174 (-) Transcript_25776:25-546(-)